MINYSKEFVSEQKNNAKIYIDFGVTLINGLSDQVSGQKIWHIIRRDVYLIRESQLGSGSSASRDLGRTPTVLLSAWISSRGLVT